MNIYYTIIIVYIRINKSKEYKIFMKKKFFVLLFLLCGLAVFAQENKMSAGLGLEWNMNSRHNFAGGAVLAFDYALFDNFSLGATLTVSNNFFGITVIEPTGHARGYVWENCHGRLFLQVDLGAFIILEDPENSLLPEFGLRAGFRKPLKSSFYIEPYGRLGYAFAFSIGLMAGISF